MAQRMITWSRDQEHVLLEGSQFAGVTKRLQQVPPKLPLGHCKSYHSPFSAAKNPRLRGNYANWSPKRPIQNRWMSTCPHTCPKAPRGLQTGAQTWGGCIPSRPITETILYRIPLSLPPCPPGEQSHNPPREGNYVRTNPLL